jgi:hypothetical protein
VIVLCQLLATLCAGLFTGAAWYVTLVEHPARISCGTRLAITEFAPSYKRGAVMQASLAVFGSLSAFAAWLLGASKLWLLGAILLAAVIPFTLAVILPTNKRLLDPLLDQDSELASRLLHRWGKLHAVRSGVSLASFLIFLYSALRNA